MWGVPEDNLEKNLTFFAFYCIFELSVARGRHCTKKGNFMLGIGIYAIKFGIFRIFPTY